MLQLLDFEALRLDGDARREPIQASLRASRGGTVRRRIGGRLVNVGERLAPETASLKAASDCG